MPDTTPENYSTPTEPFPPDEYAARMKKLNKALEKQKVDACFVFTDVNRQYFSGFESSNGLLLVRPGDTPVFYTDFRYLEAARKQIPFAAVKPLKKLNEQFGPVAKQEQWHSVAYEGGLTIAQADTMRAAMPTVKEWKDCSGWLMTIRSVKSPREQKIMRRAIAMNDLVFAKAMEQVRPGMSEWDIRRELRYWGDRFGQEQSFAIVCVGSNASNCHHHPGKKVLRRNQELLIDTGTKVQGYLSDMTRTVFFGKPSKKLAELYAIVLKANLKAISSIQAGKTCHEVDTAARSVIEKGGYGKYFGHGLGHGVGLQIHENPFFSKNNSMKLKAGMIVTVEPGIYLPGIGGVRIEDMVVVKKNGCEVLTKTPKELTCY